MKILLSIKPEFAERILNGTKRFEFRKVAFRDRSVTEVVIYATQPVGRVVGSFTIAGIIEDTPEQVWRETRDQAGITGAYFNAYFEGRKKAIAIKVGEVVKYLNPLVLHEFGPNLTPPQSFRYLP